MFDLFAYLKRYKSEGKDLSFTRRSRMCQIYARALGSIKKKKVEVLWVAALSFTIFLQWSHLWRCRYLAKISELMWGHWRKGMVVEVSTQCGEMLRSQLQSKSADLR